MPINEESKKRKQEFIDQLISSGINTIEIPKSRGSLFKVKQHIVYIRTTTKDDPKYWYDIPSFILNQVDYLIFQTTSKYHFVLLPIEFIKRIYHNLKDSNRENTKIFYIDWYNDSGEKLTSADFSIDISNYCCSIKENEEYGEFKILKNK